ncbi:MgtC/SapB family protein [Halonatronum saccharophilum]|uniref:MgtC/SapB family protein n=1 Tax=Halonatronum saccharophilum TaxID=150060 RepID=UPI000480B47A|nr:MgtC/SapB family protein [Halonatronum saccharophilum]
MDDKEIVLRLVLSCLLGGLIGLERERSSRPAGFRTNILVSIGSTLMMIVSLNVALIFDTGRADPGRIAAQVVTGVGFLGAGTIIREGFSVKGLTTAAGLWAVSGIGLALGAGFYLSAITATILVILTLTLLARVENNIMNINKVYLFRIKTLDRSGVLGKVGSIFGDYNISIRDISIEHCYDDPSIYINFKVKKPRDAKVNNLFSILNEVEGIKEVQIREVD